MKPARRIFKCVYGSRLYGTELPTSDYDTRSVVIPSGEDIILQRVKGAQENKKTEDSTEIALHKFFNDVAGGQSYAVETLFAPRQFWVFGREEWLEVRKDAMALLNSNCEAMVGYAKSQAFKYSKKSKEFKKLSELIETLYGLPQDRPVPFEILDDLDFEESPQGDPMAGICGAAFLYSDSAKNAIKKLEPTLSRYGKRVRANTTGLDLKALYHAVRISHQIVELMVTGQMTFPRPEKGVLMDIRAGLLSEERCYELVDEMMGLVEQVKLKTGLPTKTPKELQEQVDRLTIKWYGAQVRE